MSTVSVCLVLLTSVLLELVPLPLWQIDKYKNLIFDFTNIWYVLLITTLSVQVLFTVCSIPAQGKSAPARVCSVLWTACASGAVR